MRIVWHFQYLPKTFTFFIIDLDLAILYRDPLSLQLLYAYIRNIGKVSWNAITRKSPAFKD